MRYQIWDADKRVLLTQEPASREDAVRILERAGFTPSFSRTLIDERAPLPGDLALEYAGITILTHEN